MAESPEEKTFKKVGQLKEGNFVLIDNEVCRIKNIEKSKPGKHGSTKARITAIGVFDSQKRNLLRPTSADAEVPIIKRSNAQVVAVLGKTVQIMDLESYGMMDVQKPAEIGSLKSGDEVEYIQYGKNISIVRAKGST